MRIDKIENIIGYAFKDKTLLERAFIHSSYANEHNIESYDRLEFLGDGVLGLIVAESLYFVGENEGDMTVKRSLIVSSRPLEDCITELGLDKFLIFGEGESKQVHAHRKVLSDVYEAILGAIYLDGGLNSARKFVTATLGERITEVLQKEETQNYKGELQEYCQAHRLGDVRYYTVDCKGPDHAPQFTVEVSIGGKVYAKNTGLSTKEAQRSAAKSALEILTRDNQ